MRGKFVQQTYAATARRRKAQRLQRAKMAVGSNSPLASSRTASSPHSTRSEEHTSELQSLMRISYAVFCLKKTNETDLPTSPPAYQKYNNNIVSTHRKRISDE